ncbi:rhodanese-like domain-containing protein [Marinifilum sp. D714]|uniref:rhodanese-like domain-containing protein n=1 Tax=Marinifilum sp. D714 TaxID=2937523 RepID=UPI0027BB4951|nr:rhodanese-like domain-containing protein [Marinifilum sp. D714]MDQ2178069.1 rhodanese-like domain-containing protein [Marinifilum sp. D714]
MKTIKAFFFICLIALVGCNSNSSGPVKSYESVDEMVADIRTNVTEIYVSDFHTLMNSEDPYVLLDVRLPMEHNRGYIPGSVSIPRGVLEFRIGSEKVWDEEGLYVPEKEELLILYCKKSNRSPLAALRLQQLGYKNVKVISGGWHGWHEAYPEISEDNIEEGGMEYAATEEEDSGGC